MKDSKTDFPQVLILGYGEMGHALEFLLKDCVNLHIWDKFPKDGFESVILESAATLAEIVIFCLPVNPHREIAERILPHIKQDTVLVSIAKGLDESGQTAAQIFADVFNKHQPCLLLYGPMISEEIQLGKVAFAQLGYRDKSAAKHLQSLFTNPHLSNTRLYINLSADITGITWSVILKNVYALAFGMADELNLGDNMRGYLSVMALAELDQIVQQLGGFKGTPYQLAGLGDLITTATSKDSHHHELGQMLARGETENIKGEGVHTLAMVEKYQLFKTSDFPLFTTIRHIVKNPKKVNDQLNAYLSSSISGY